MNFSWVMLVCLVGLARQCPEEDPCRACSADGKCRLCSDSLLLPTDECGEVAEVADCDTYMADMKNPRCQQCELGYQLRGDHCEVCSQGCAMCPIKGKCAACFKGLLPDSKGQACTKDNGVCVDANCDVCQQINKCLRCKSGYAVDENFVCVKTPNHCQAAQAPGVCVECRNGYYLKSDGSCMETKSRFNPKLLWFSLFTTIFLLNAIIILCIRKPVAPSKPATQPAKEPLIQKDNSNLPSETEVRDSKQKRDGPPKKADDQKVFTVEPTPEEPKQQERTTDPKIVSQPEETKTEQPPSRPSQPPSRPSQADAGVQPAPGVSADEAPAPRKPSKDNPSVVVPQQIDDAKRNTSEFVDQEEGAKQDATK